MSLHITIPPCEQHLPFRTSLICICVSTQARGQCWVSASVAFCHNFGDRVFWWKWSSVVHLDLLADWPQDFCCLSKTFRLWVHVTNPDFLPGCGDPNFSLHYYTAGRLPTKISPQIQKSMFKIQTEPIETHCLPHTLKFMLEFSPALYSIMVMACTILNHSLVLNLHVLPVVNGVGQLYQKK